MHMDRETAEPDLERFYRAQIAALRAERDRLLQELHRAYYFLGRPIPVLNAVEHAEDGTPVVNTACYCEKCEGRTREMYYLRARCGNCATEFVLKVRKGDQPGENACPGCGVRGSHSLHQRTSTPMGIQP